MPNNKHNEFIASTIQLIYTAIRSHGQCGMYTLFDGKEITDEAIKKCYENRAKFCESQIYRNLNEEICERLLKMSMEDRIRSYKTAKEKFLVDT